MEPELKHLAPYLPYKLKCQVTDKRKKKIATLGGLYNDGNCVFHDTIESEKGFKRIKPLLFPMSSLYTEMEDGTVPIVELAKITGWLTIQDWEVSHKVVDGCFTCGVRWFDEEDEKYYVFGWDEVNGFGMHERPSRDIHFVPNQLKLFTYLFENHFDVFGLIDKGLALDKTKIK